LGVEEEWLALAVMSMYTGAKTVIRTVCGNSNGFWLTVLSVEPMVQYVVCLSVVCRSLSVCNVLYCGKTVRPSEKVSEGVNRKPGSKS